MWSVSLNIYSFHFHYIVFHTTRKHCFICCVHYVMLLVLWLFWEHAQSLFFWILSKSYRDHIEEMKVGSSATSTFILSIAVGITCIGHQGQWYCFLLLSGAHILSPIQSNASELRQCFLIFCTDRTESLPHFFASSSRTMRSLLMISHIVEIFFLLNFCTIRHPWP